MKGKKNGDEKLRNRREESLNHKPFEQNDSKNQEKNNLPDEVTNATISIIISLSVMMAKRQKNTCQHKQGNDAKPKTSELFIFHLKHNGNSVTQVSNNLGSLTSFGCIPSFSKAPQAIHHSKTNLLHKMLGCLI